MTETEACRKVLEERLDAISKEIEKLLDEARHEDVLVELSDLLDRVSTEKAKRRFLESILEDFELKAQRYLTGTPRKVRYINGIPTKSRYFAYDNCHKIYLLDDDDVDEARRSGYRVVDIEVLPEVWASTCPARFIYTWKLRPPIVRQFGGAEFGDGWDIPNELRAKIDSMKFGITYNE